MSQVTLKTIYDLIQDFRTEVKGAYVTKDEFKPVKTIVYGIVTLVLVSVAGAILALVVRANGH